MYKKINAPLKKKDTNLGQKQKSIQFLCLSNTYISLNKIVGAVFEKIEAENLSHCK